MKATIIAAAIITAIATTARAESGDEMFRRAAAKGQCRAVTAITVGMTTRDVERSCWGRPDHEQTTTTAAGVERVWIWEWKSGHRAAYLRNGVVVVVRELQ